MAELRAAIANDPLVTDPSLRSEPMVRGIAALRQAASAKASAPEGVVASAVELLETAVAGARDSSEAHRVLATAHSIAGDIARSVQHLRDAVRLNPRDERSRLALAQTLPWSVGPRKLRTYCARRSLNCQTRARCVGGYREDRRRTG